MPFQLEDPRDYIIKYGAAQGFNSQARSISDHARSAIDDLAGQIPGNPQYFWQASASAGGNQLAFGLATEKDAKRRKLMGVRIPVLAVRMNLT